MEVDDDVQVKEEASSEHGSEEAPREEKPKEEPKEKAKPREEPKQQAAPSGKVLATPAVRAMAMEMKIDLTKVTPTGKGGRITKDDVLNFSKSKQPEPTAARKEQPVAPVAMEQDNLRKLTGIRRAMVKSMTDALVIPPYNVQDYVCIEQVKKIRKDYVKFNPGKKLTYLPFFIKAFSQAMLEYPVFNSITNPNVDSEGYIYEYIEKAEHNISIAIDSPAGLVVPNIKSIQRKSIVQINEEVRALIERGRTGTLTHDDLSDGTFTLSSISNIGSRVGTPVIFRPQVAIAAMCRTETVSEFTQKANGECEVRPVEVTHVSLTCDHRIIDSVTAGKFMNAVKKHVEDIKSLLLTLK
eukprot:TRINITY_DN6990_c0_g1_i1.p1 TRINITY_DN6990_c0_g1~~TRINITY_DN6990_c0_g1_i1.p1  ORF type:complete len:354 (+),score=130.78 TRINITY_DN6990_c0_g1_i1:245-1306(+)